MRRHASVLATALTLAALTTAPARASAPLEPSSALSAPGGAAPLERVPTGLTAPTAEAAGPLLVTVTVILARKAGTPLEVAPELASLGQALGRAFPDHRRFSRLGRHALSVTAEGAPAVTLPNGSSLTLRHGGLKTGRHTLQVEVGGLRTTAQVAPGATFFQAGRAHDGGMLVLAFEVAR